MLLRSSVLYGIALALVALSNAAQPPVAGLPAFAERRNAGLARLEFDLTDAAIVTPTAAAPAVLLLQEEVRARTLVSWPIVGQRDPARAAVLLRRRSDPLPDLGADLIPREVLPAEGFHLRTSRLEGRPLIVITGEDDRGLLFGVGHLLRQLQLGPQRAGLTSALAVSTSPRYPVRGIQLGYRGMSNSYAGWDPGFYERQIRDVAIFGANVIELVVGFSDAPAPEFPVPYEEMMRETSRLSDRYGLDYWIVSPVRDRDYTKPAEVARTLSEWEQIYRLLPRLDGVFVPGGDPGNTPPEQLLPLLAQQAAVLHRHHPRARLWVSAQGFSAAGIETFFSYLHREQPAWLTGVVSAAWTDLSTAEIRRRTPARYQVISSTDIGHVLHCQQPLQNFDTAIAITQGREPICPRPSDMAQLVRVTQPGTSGSLAYSDGATDDINKMLWAALNWDPDRDPDVVLQEYARYFLGERLTESGARGIRMLERNWQGPLKTNSSVAETLQHFQTLEREASPELRRNWRFLSLLYRAYYDSYTQKRLLHETALEAEANRVLLQAPATGANEAMKLAVEILARPPADPALARERLRIFQLAEALFQTIRMKLSVPLYGATAQSRGANLDSIDWPLNNRRWLEARFAEIRRLPDEAEKVARLQRIARWTDPGPGGVYDDPGRPDWNSRASPPDPADARFHHSAHAIKTWVRAADFSANRLAWFDHIATLGLTPLELSYEGLDSSAKYHVRVVYADTKLNNRVRLLAGGKEVHGLRKGPVPAQPEEFTIPPGAVRDGKLVLRWEKDPAIPSIKGVAHVSEIWLIRQP